MRLSYHLTDVRTRFILVCKSCGQSCMGCREQKSNCAENHFYSANAVLCHACAMPCCAVFSASVFMLCCGTLTISLLLGNLCWAMFGRPRVSSCSNACYATPLVFTFWEPMSGMLSYYMPCCCLECANEMLYDFLVLFHACSFIFAIILCLSAGVSARSLQCIWHLSYHALCSG